MDADDERALIVHEDYHLARERQAERRKSRAFLIACATPVLACALVVLLGVLGVAIPPPLFGLSCLVLLGAMFFTWDAIPQLLRNSSRTRHALKQARKDDALVAKTERVLESTPGRGGLELTESTASDLTVVDPQEGSLTPTDDPRDA